MRQLADINAWARELIVEGGVEDKFPDDMFVFLMHQGYSFLYFPLDGSNDPPVYLYVDGDPAPKQVAPCFSDWVAGIA
jgi:hypothetical protein